MSEPTVPVIFVNSLAVRGFANGVLNLAFSTAQFLPETTGGETIVGAQEIITANLRMDLFCAQQVYAALGAIIEQQTKPVAKTDVN